MRKMVELIKVYLLDRARSPVTVAVSLIWGLTLFVFMYLIFDKGGIQFGADQSFKELFVASYAVFIPAYIAILGIPHSVSEEKSNGLFKVYRSSRLSKAEYVGSKILEVLIAGSAVSVLVLLFGIYLTNFSVPLGVFALSIILTVIAHSGIGVLVSEITADRTESSMLLPLIMLALVVGTPVFYPSTLLPETVQPLQQFIPLTHSIEVLRIAAAGQLSLDLLLEKILILSAFSTLLLGASYRYFEY